MTTNTLTNPACAADLAQIHLSAFPDFFLTFMGKGFLEQIYKGFIAHKDSDVIGAFDADNQLIGFVAYSKNISHYYNFLIKKSLVPLIWYSFFALIKRPSATYRLLRALTYPKVTARPEAYVKLSSIGVLPKAGDQGVGTLLVKAMMNEIDPKQYAYVELETDRFGNEATNKFYVRNGFRLFRSLTTPEGREMNVYRFDTH